MYIIYYILFIIYYRVFSSAALAFAILLKFNICLFRGEGVVIKLTTYNDIIDTSALRHTVRPVAVAFL